MPAPADVDVPRLPLRTGPSIPQVGLGTWQLEGDTCERTVRAALELGYRHVDTAEMYGNEDRIGRALADAEVDRDEVFLTSKVWRDHLRRDAVREACEGSLGRLGTDRLDLYLIHWPNRDVPVGETVEALQELEDEGKIGAWGVSNFTRTHLEETHRHGRPAVDQVELHPFLRQASLDRFCRDHDIFVTAYSPLARGDVAGSPLLGRIGERHGKSPVQVALRWSIQHGHVVIPKSSGEEHLEDDLRLFDFELTGDEMASIDGLDEGRRLVEPDFAEFDRDG